MSIADVGIRQPVVTSLTSPGLSFFTASGIRNVRRTRTREPIAPPDKLSETGIVCRDLGSLAAPYLSSAACASR